MTRLLQCVGLLALLLLLGCAEQKMADQPRYDTYEPGPFFRDGRSARQPVAGTVARGQLQDDVLLATGKAASGDKNFANEFPFAITEQVLLRGQQRYNIFCAVCHGYTGEANGMIVERGYLRPPNFIRDEARGYQLEDKKVSLRDVPQGYLFEVITNGYGGMPDYRAELPPRDRWAVVAYLRALQVAQSVPVAELAPAERQHLEATRGGKQHE